jgi:hypothetical protein
VLDEYVGLQPHEAVEIQTRLHRGTSPYTTNRILGKVPVTMRNSLISAFNIIIRLGIEIRKTTRRFSYRNFSSNSAVPLSEVITHKQPNANHVFLLLCNKRSVWATKLEHLELSEVLDNRTLMKKCREKYYNIRGHWRYFFWMRKVTSIKFVQVRR